MKMKMKMKMKMTTKSSPPPLWSTLDSPPPTRRTWRELDEATPYQVRRLETNRDKAGANWNPPSLNANGLCL